MEHVCRKVALRPGERVVEVGCGWGALALHMARQYGVLVRAFNISREQIVYARAQARREGLAARVEFIEDDYRNVSGAYDAFVSVGMLEHVGTAHYQELGRMIDRCLPAHGRGLIHTIGRNRPTRLNAWAEKYIFPGAYPPTLREMMEIFEPSNFSVLDVENLRLHYARTLEHWLARYERSAGRVAEMFDDRFVRAWRLYLAGSIAAFVTGSVQLFQVTFARPRHNAMPWTRAHLYAP
jgi:cyclopropane-fatty-acyl-phospholipid synthase